MDMLTEKYSQKAEIKKDELEFRRMVLEFTKGVYRRGRRKKGKVRSGNARKEGNSQPFERPSLEEKRRKKMFIALCPFFTACSGILL